MVTKPKQPRDEGTEDAPDLAGMVRESAQQIWLAGLGAFSKAQEEGGKVFQALVKEGVTLQRRTSATAGDRLNDATSRMAAMASELSNKASGQWDKLESLFEERVARTMKQLGVPSSADMDELAARVEDLERTVAALRAAAGPRATARTTARSGVRKAAVKRPVVAKAARKRAPAR